MKRIGYMGIEGSFSEHAAKVFLERLQTREAGEGTEATEPASPVSVKRSRKAEEETETAELIPLVCAKRIREALEHAEISCGVVGVDNTLVGEVREFHEAFDGVSYTILDSCTLPVHHCLYKKAGADEHLLNEVTSHIHALKQTARTRKERYPRLRETEAEDTALAAKDLAQGRLADTTAVICSREAGELWGLELVEENIEDSGDNRTRFYLISE